jgi:hypothetical protein
MQMVRWSQLDFDTGWQPVYNVRAMVVEGPRIGMFLVQVVPLPRATQTPFLPTWKSGPLATAGPPTSTGPTPSRCASPRRGRSIVVVSEGGLTVDQALALACAPELHLFG